MTIEGGALNLCRIIIIELLLVTKGKVCENKRKMEFDLYPTPNPFPGRLLKK
jgi:hypothetical protein